ncbi:hypothetical protein E2C01_083500 [Portunus trituberculatus]|uniref:Uncharacterized protein n=1 Tax=Portunus trituberculatus TaxID=210409 RepID=A0A5B7J3N6_PORTR|nr:hypothetical protein [Portunus trituberculatus]
MQVKSVSRCNVFSRWQEQRVSEASPGYARHVKERKETQRSIKDRQPGHHKKCFKGNKKHSRSDR